MRETSRELLERLGRGPTAEEERASARATEDAARRVRELEGRARKLSPGEALSVCMIERLDAALEGADIPAPVQAGLCELLEVVAAELAEQQAAIERLADTITAHLGAHAGRPPARGEAAAVIGRAREAEAADPLIDARAAGEAWRAFLADPPDDWLEGDVPGVCEGCAGPATRSDSEGVPLCAPCFAALTPLPAPERGPRAV